MPQKKQVELPEKLLFLLAPKRYKVAHGGRGGAKSWGFARALLLLGAARPLRIMCAREIMNSIADSVHRLLSDQIVALGLEQFYEVTNTAIRGINGSEFLFAGLRQQDAHKIKSFEGVDICWVEEAQAVSARSWSILTPTIRKPGSEIWVSFNPDLDTDPTYLRYVVTPPKDSVVVEVNYDDNPWFPPELEQERLDSLARDSTAEYENVWLGRCKTVVDGAIYAGEIEALYREPRRIRPVPYDPALLVHTVWDLGWNDALTIICVQKSASEMRVIDYIEDSLRDLPSYVKELKEKPYLYGHDWIPHDGASTNITAGGQTTEKILRGLGRSVRVIPRGDIEEGIKAARALFPRCYFDEDRALPLVNRLKRYRRNVPQSTGEAGAPRHDENSHGADAFRYLATIAHQLRNDTERTVLNLKSRAHGGAHGWMGG